MARVTASIGGPIAVKEIVERADQRSQSEQAGVLVVSLSGHEMVIVRDDPLGVRSM